MSEISEDWYLEFSRKYVDKNIEVLKHLDMESISRVGLQLYNAKQNGKQIFFCGNGGSMSIATHMACDFGKGTKGSRGSKRYRAISLDNISWITAQANDGEDYFNKGNFTGNYEHGYDGIFVGQLENLINAGDIVFVISSSGNSSNIINALDYSKDRGALTIAMVGFDGGKAAEKADNVILVPTAKGEYGLVEGIHEIIHHLLYEAAIELERLS